MTLSLVICARCSRLAAEGDHPPLRYFALRGLAGVRPEDPLCAPRKWNALKALTALKRWAGSDGTVHAMV